ncbi:MAG: hypothetical protein KDB35_06545, partial [Acidimicrobiales bacterium]|nr:hypothetical protein [Acidimicrobiales bacterium]
MLRRRLAPLVLVSLAPLAAAGEPAQAEEGLDTGEDPSGDWALLDSELEALDAVRQSEQAGPVVWGFLRTNVTHSDELDIDGAFLDAVRLYLDGAVGGTDYRVSFDGQSGSATILDAYAHWSFGEELHATFGRFRQPFLRSSLTEFNRLLMILRTRSGTLHSVRDNGAMIGGHHGRVHWDLALQNGLDSVADDYLTTGRVTVDVLGEPSRPWEGAFGGPDETRLSVGLAYADDGALGDGGA